MKNQCSGAELWCSGAELWQGGCFISFQFMQFRFFTLGVYERLNPADVV